MGKLPHAVRHNLDRPELERIVEFVRREKPFPFRGDFPRQSVEYCLLGRVFRFACDTISRICGAGVFVPCERFVDQILADPKMVESRIPFGLGKKRVDPRVGVYRPAPVVGTFTKNRPCCLIFKLVPFPVRNIVRGSCGR